jgi:predicted RecA/RadA family phage recombinase
MAHAIKSIGFGNEPVAANPFPPGTSGYWTLLTNGHAMFTDPAGVVHDLTASGVYPMPFACAVAVTFDDAVYLSSADTVAKASAAGVSTMPCLGFVFDKPTPTSCLVMHHGEISTFAGLVIGQAYFVSTTAGGIAKVGDAGMPTLSGQVVQPIGRPRNSTSMLIAVDANIATLDIL